MNRAFEDFVVTALRDALDLSESRFRQGTAIYLDRGRHVRMRPDITWWEAGQCRFVGDVKYKRLEAEGIQHADLYQLLSYTIATDLPGDSWCTRRVKVNRECTRSFTSGRC